MRYVASYLTGGNIENAYSDTIRFAFTLAITLVLAMVNYSGLELVGNLSIIVCIISMSPFLVMMICAIPKLDTNRWFVMPEADIDIGNTDDGDGLLATPMFAGVYWRPLLNSLFWNLVCYDSLSLSIYIYIYGLTTFVLTTLICNYAELV